MMKNECTVRIYKRDGKDVTIGSSEPEKKRVIVRNVWNSRELVEIEVDGVRLELSGRDITIAVENALRVPML